MDLSDLQKAILIAIDGEVRSPEEYRASTKFLIELLGEYSSEQVGSMVERMVEIEGLVEGRGYSPREGESFRYYIYMSLTIKGQEILKRWVSSPQPVQADLFDG